MTWRRFAAPPGGYSAPRPPSLHAVRHLVRGEHQRPADVSAAKELLACRYRATGTAQAAMPPRHPQLTQPDFGQTDFGQTVRLRRAMSAGFDAARSGPP